MKQNDWYACTGILCATIFYVNGNVWMAAAMGIAALITAGVN